MSATDPGRPAIAESRLSLLPDGRVAYSLKKTWRDGSTHVVMEPQVLIEFDRLDIGHRCHRSTRCVKFRGVGAEKGRRPRSRQGSPQPSALRLQAG